VARFVGADRASKRLSLSRVADLEARPAVMARVGEDAAGFAAAAAETPYLLLVDGATRPIGWLPSDRLPRSGPLRDDHAVPMSPLLDRRTTLKDALSMLLDADVQAGIVVDRAGAVLGLVTVDMIAERMRATAGEPSYPGAASELVRDADGRDDGLTADRAPEVVEA
jgi:osmoprotectant transport system ATP-binding protein